MPTSPNPADDALLKDLFERAYFGDRAARNRIFEIVNPCFYLLRIANDEVSARHARSVEPADVVQDTLVHGIEFYAAFPGHSRRALLLWLRRVLHFKLLGAQRDVARRARREAPLAAADVLCPDPIPTPLQQLERRESWLQIEQALPKLMAADQCLIRLRVFEDRSFEDIGQRLSCSENAAQKRFVRAFQRLWLQIGAPPSKCSPVGQRFQFPGHRTRRRRARHAVLVQIV